MDKIEIWGQVLDLLSKKIARMEFGTWFKNVELKEIAGAALLISCPSEMHKNWLENKYHSILLSTVKKTMPEIEKLFFEVDLTLAHRKNPTHAEIFKETKPRKLPNQPTVKLNEHLESRQIQSKFSLQNFIVGEENRFAHAACNTVAENATSGISQFNPLYVYGGVGLGKTHLLQGTAAEILRRNPQAVVVYTTAERFTNEIIQAIAKKKTEELRRKYRRVDVLLIDDVQFFAGKDQTQIEVFNTFNDLRDQDKQMIFSGDCPPAQLEGMADRLTSRLGWGLIVDICMPSFETKTMIIQQKAQEQGLILPEEVVNFIAINVRKNLRELENVLNQIGLIQELSQIAPTVQTVGQIFRKLHPTDQLLSDSTHPEARLAKNADDIITLVSDYFQIPATDLLGASRKQNVVFPRQTSWLLCKDVLNMSLESIGEAFGGKNHTTIMHGIKKIKTLTREDSATARHIHALKKDLGAV